MLKPLDLASRLSVLLETIQATIVNMDDIYDKRKALNNCRAPAVGWEDYISRDENGEPRDYMPPTFAHDPQHFYGPKDGTAWTRDERGPISVPSNPHSKKYGGVRPWSPDEIAEAMLDDEYVPGSYFPWGIRSLINRFKHHHQAAQPGVRFNVEEHLGKAMEALNMAIAKDQGRVGTEFTKYLALHMDLPGGAPAGYYGEHRTIRGILTKLAKMINRIAAQVESGDYDSQALITIIGDLGSKKITLQDADPSIPRAKNLFGGFAERLQRLYQDFSKLIEAGDADGIRAMSDIVTEFYEDVNEEEQVYSGEGMAHGRLGSQPRDMPAIGTRSHRLKPIKFLIYVVDPDLEQMDLQKVNDSPEELTSDDVIIKRDPESGAPVIRHFGTIESGTEFRAISAGRDAYAKQKSLPRQLVALLPFSAKQSEKETGAGFHGISGLTMTTKKGREIERPGLPGIESHAEADPEFKNELAEILFSLRYGSAKQKMGQAHRALDIIDHLFSVIEHTINPRPRPQLEARPDTRTGARASYRAGGYNIVDTEKNQIVARAESEREAAEVLERMNNPILTSLRYISRMLSRPQIGDAYYDDLADMARDIAQAVQAGDEGALADAAEELRMTKSLVEEDLEISPEEHTPMLTHTQYRIALRKLGITNYPEKGTVNDPEIDEHGNLSRWAQAGYPLVQKDVSRGKGELAGTLYKPGEEDVGEVMVDKHIARDLNISPQSVGNNWRKVRDKLSQLAEQLYEHHVWAGDLDEVDLRLLRETCNRLAIIMIEEIRYAAQLMRG